MSQIYLVQAGSRKVLLDAVSIVWNDVSALIKSNAAGRSPLLGKYLIKLTQRIGLVCLPYCSPSWRYKYVEQLSDSNAAVRRGSVLALDVLPYEFLAKRWKDIISKLARSCEIEDNPDDRDAEARVNAVKGLVSACEIDQYRNDDICATGEDDMPLFLLIKNEVMKSLFKALDDYSVDNRGNVGSRVCEAAMDGLERCSYILCKRGVMGSQNKAGKYVEVPEHNLVNGDKVNPLFDAELVTNLVAGILKQAVEKMDKIREAAAYILQRILYNKTIFIPFIPNREKLEEIIPNDTDLKWGLPTLSYPRFVQLLILVLIVNLYFLDWSSQLVGHKIL